MPQENLAIRITRVFSLFTGGAALIALIFGIFRFIQTSQANTVAIETFSERLIGLELAIAKQDSAFALLTESMCTQRDDIISITEALQNTQRSYTRHLMRDNTLTKEEFYRYMEGLDVQKKGLTQYKNNGP